MNIPSLASGLSTMKTLDAVGVSLLRTAKENLEEQGNTIAAMIDSVDPVGKVAPNSGSTIDILI